MYLLHNRYNIIVTTSGLPQDFAFDLFLFLEEKHMQTQSEDERLLFQLLDEKTNEIVAHLPFFIDGKGLAYSPGKAPFGSVQFKSRLQEELVFEFLQFAKRYLTEQKNCRAIKIKSYPFAYAPEAAAVLTDLLLKQEVSICHSEINHHIAVSNAALENKLHSSALRRLQKCKKHGFSFQEEPAAVLPEIWRFINACRMERGYEEPIPESELEHLFHDFPQKFRIFTVRQAGELAAATIAVRINEKILYNFYPASPLRFNVFSPVVMLIEGLYNVCRQEGVNILDLGTSNLPSGPNFPLIAFKKHLGAEASLKLTFTSCKQDAGCFLKD